MSYLARLKAKIGEKPPPRQLTELTKGASVSFGSTQGEGFCRNDDGEPARKTPAGRLDSIRDAIEERAALCAGVVPAIYLDTWARLNHQKPMTVSDEEWRRALDDGGRFFDTWGALAVEWGWTVRELFDAPREGRQGGLILFIGGEQVEAFGPDHARLSDGRIYDRGTIGGERDG